MAGISPETPGEIHPLYTSTLSRMLDLYELHCLETSEAGTEPNREFFAVFYLGLVEYTKRLYMKIGVDIPDDVLDFGNNVEHFLIYESED
jgi:hypothetical protein